jgi:hypothetical protein
LIRDVFTALAIPLDESYDAHFFTSEGELKIINDPNAIVCYLPTSDDMDLSDLPALNSISTKPRYF